MKLLRSKMAGGLIGWLMLLIGLGAFAHAIKITIDAKSAKNWIPHLAQVQSAALNTHENDKGVKSYSIEVAYIFDWEGQTYKGTRYRVHDKPNPSPDANNEVVQSLLLTKRDDGKYPIFVNPKKPEQSAIVNSVHPKARSSSLFLGFLFSILGYFAAFKPKLFGKRSER